MLYRQTDDDPFGLRKLDMETEQPQPSPPRQEKRERSSTNSGPIPGREAAIAYAACSNAGYVERYCEELAKLNFTAPLVRAAVTAALSMTPVNMDLSVMLSAIPKPLPGYVRRNDPTGFAEALTIQAERDRSLRLRSFS
jgi:hypothetical protein